MQEPRPEQRVRSQKPYTPFPIINILVSIAVIIISFLIGGFSGFEIAETEPPVDTVFVVSDTTTVEYLYGYNKGKVEIYEKFLDIYMPAPAEDYEIPKH